jgi:hypothetical protein
VYDQAKAKPSTGSRGPYLMHLRWHFPNTANLQGRRVTVIQGKSSLVMDTLLPSNAALTVVDERNNPDGNDCTQTPCAMCEQGVDNAPSSCKPFGDQVNAGTMRVEVRTPGNPLSQEFLTAFQAGKKTMTPTLVTSSDGSMKGVQMTMPQNKTTVVLFNARSGAAPAPISSVSYQSSGPAGTQHVLAGMRPGAAYAVGKTGSTVTVTQSASGSVTASAAGVLRFKG